MRVYFASELHTLLTAVYDEWKRAQIVEVGDRKSIVDIGSGHFESISNDDVDIRSSPARVDGSRSVLGIPKTVA